MNSEKRALSGDADGIVLFNCCTGHLAPDWSQFKSLEVGGCTTETDETGTWTNGGIADDCAQFWTVYARHHSGEAEAITDNDDLNKVRAIAARLSALSGLPVL